MKDRIKLLISILLFFVLFPYICWGGSWEELIAKYKAIRRQAEGEHDYSKTLAAIDLAREALEAAQTEFGPDDPRVAETLYYLAGEYALGLDYTQAESLYLQALTIYERGGKGKTLEYARVLIGFGNLYCLQGKYEQGLAKYDGALTIIEGLPEPNSIELAQLLQYIAMGVEFTKGFSAAEPYYQRSIEVKERLFGRVHPEVAEAISAFASAYRVHERFDQSDRLYKKALAIYCKLYGKEDPRVAQYLEDVANYHYHQGAYTHAEPYYRDALRLWERIYRPDSLELAPHLVQQGKFYEACGKYDRAEAFYQKELAIKESAFGPADPRLADSLERLYLFYDARKDFPRAERYYSRLFAIQEQQGKGTSAWLENLREYADFFAKWGRWQEAERQYRRLMSAYEASPEKDDATLAQLATRLADLCAIQNKKVDAEGFYRLALASWEKVVLQEGETEAFVTFLKRMANFYRVIRGKEEEAQTLLQRAETIHTRLQEGKKETLGDSSP